MQRDKPKEAVATSSAVVGASGIPIPIGTILPFAGAFSADMGPEWMICAGQSLRKSDFDALFRVIGTAWGVGDNPPDTFNLPDLRGRFLRGAAGGVDRDPDRDRRYTTNGGNTGDSVGSLQDDQFQTHWHFSQIDQSTGAHGHLVSTTVTDNTGGHSHTVHINRSNILGSNMTRDVDGGGDKWNGDPGSGDLSASIDGDTGRHSHPVTATIPDTGGLHSHPSSVADPLVAPTAVPLQHGRETRVKNAYVNWIIRAK